MRDNYNEELTELHKKLISLGDLCEQAIAAAMNSLFEHDEKAADTVSKIEEETDRMYHDIEAFCLRLLLREQPVATDLRVVSGGLQMITDMERIGDYAGDIVGMAKFIKNDELISQIPMKELSDTATGMVRDSVSAYVEKDVDLARDVMKRDDKADEYFDSIVKWTVKTIKETDIKDAAFIDIAMISKYLERIADHAVNICEDVIFTYTGERVKDSDPDEE
ncbi:MAG: phosphate signaling complex protein PhoU [Anaerovoracaceae bacterium]